MEGNIDNNTVNVNICQDIESECFEESNCCLFPWLKKNEKNNIITKRECVCDNIDNEYYEYLKEKNKNFHTKKVDQNPRKY